VVGFYARFAREALSLDALEVGSKDSSFLRELDFASMTMVRAKESTRLQRSSFLTASMSIAGLC
jgi:hypothetical protein